MPKHPFFLSLYPHIDYRAFLSSIDFHTSKAEAASAANTKTMFEKSSENCFEHRKVGLPIISYLAFVT
jgi:hypothetical protein